MKRFLIVICVLAVLAIPVLADQNAVAVQGIVSLLLGGTGASTAIGARNNLELGSAWEDLRFPAMGINPPGAATDPTRDTTDGLLSFSGSQDNVCVFQVQMPHGWESGAGSYLIPHLHILNTAASAGTTTWQLDYKIANINGNFPATWTTDTINYVVPAATSTHVMPAFAHIDMTGFTSSSMLVMKLSRLGSSDDYNTAVKLLEYDIHYKHNKFGAGSY